MYSIRPKVIAAVLGVDHAAREPYGSMARRNNRPITLRERQTASLSNYKRKARTPSLPVLKFLEGETK
jgi:hypothetical protein